MTFFEKEISSTMVLKVCDKTEQNVPTFQVIHPKCSPLAKHGNGSHTNQAFSANYRTKLGTTELTATLDLCALINPTHNLKL